MVIDTMTILFRNEISHTQLPKFRGAVINAAGKGCSVLFHNHMGNELRYSYPLIQYKRIDGRAAIVCVNEGCSEIAAIIEQQGIELQLGKEKPQIFEPLEVIPTSTPVQLWNEGFAYRIESWLPLNKENYHRYKETVSLAERIIQLENILLANILSVCKSWGLYFEEELICRITKLSEPRKILFKGHNCLSFDVEMIANITLPDYIGLGHGVSLGHGTLRHCLE